MFVAHYPGREQNGIIMRLMANNSLKLHTIPLGRLGMPKMQSPAFAFVLMRLDWGDKWSRRERFFPLLSLSPY